MNTRKVRLVLLVRSNAVLALSQITPCRILKANSHRLLTTNSTWLTVLDHWIDTYT